MDSAFDGNTSTAWGAARKSGPSWIGKSGIVCYHFMKADVNIKIRLADKDYQTYWVIQGSTDGTNWVDVSERKLPLTAGTFTFLQNGVTDNFTYLRLYSDNTLTYNDTSAYTQIAELDFYSFPDLPIIYSSIVDYGFYQNSYAYIYYLK